MNNLLYTINISAIYRFLGIAKYKSFEKASYYFHTTPSTLIRSMNLLEGTLEVKLFYRSPRGVTLTNEGRIFEAYAYQLIADLEDMAECLHGRKRSGNVRWENQVVQNLREIPPDMRNAVVRLTDDLANAERNRPI